MARPRRPTPPPLETNDIRVAVAGVAAWAVALVVLAVMGLPKADRWWLWVCVTGIVIGLFAIVYIPRLHRARAAVIAQHATGEPDPAEPVRTEAAGRERGAGEAGVEDDARPERSTEDTGADRS